jgi:malate dehydrogenase (oxaloacetate-decarboxylating)
VFPGLGLGVTAARASRITDGMIAAAADAVAGFSDATRPGAPLLPPVSDLRPVSAAVAIAVAHAAEAEGLARTPLDNPIEQVRRAMWRPDYPRVEAKPL